VTFILRPFVLVNLGILYPRLTSL